MKYEWLEDEDPRYTTTLGAAITATDATSITIATGFVGNVVEGHILLIGTEQLLVGVTNGANPVPVTRGYAGTTAATASNGATVRIIGRVHKEGAVAPQDAIQYPTLPYNFVQEFAASVTMTELEMVNKRLGIDDALEYETNRKARQLFVALEQQCFWGSRVQGSASVPSAFGGLETFIPGGNFVDAASGALTATMVMDAMQKCYDQAGPSAVPDTIVCGPYVRRKLSTIYATYNVTTQRMQSDRRGGVKVDTITTDFGDLDIMISPWLDPQKLYILKRDRLHIGPYGGKTFKRQMMAKVGTAETWMISGAYTFAVRSSKFHAGVKNISLSA
jgi:hypothetical protein